MELSKVLLEALASGALGALAFTIFANICAKWPVVDRWVVLAKRVAVFALCALLVLPVYALAVGMLWLPLPVDWRAWVNSVGAYAMLAYLASQAGHAIQKQREEDREVAPH